MSQHLNTEQFIEKAREVHGDFYDYSKVEYTNAHTKVIITCPEHGDFEQLPSNHKSGYKCPKCNFDNKKSNTNEFIKKAKAIHGDKYDYNKVEYKTNHTKVIITCPIHGDFEQTPANHKSGQNCPKCKYEKHGIGCRSNTTEFIEKAKAIHGDKYDYSKVEYTRNKGKVIIVCSTHGEFIQEPNSHLNKRGCPKCAVGSSKKEQEVNDFIESLGINTIQNDRTVIKPKEIDILIE